MASIPSQYTTMKTYNGQQEQQVGETVPLG